MQEHPVRKIRLQTEVTIYAYNAYWNTQLINKILHNKKENKK